jgi:hypothetical protein
MADSAAAWGALFALDSMMFGMTVARAISVRKTADRPLINVLVRDGKSVFQPM